jgi:predicted lipoprotein with Yx(FWY)xxD motif
MRSILIAAALAPVAACVDDVEIARLRLADGAVVGPHLVDAEGRTLYLSGRDVPADARGEAVSRCAGACAEQWTGFYTGEVVVGPGLDASDFGELGRSDGRRQSTYKGWPIYRYAADAAGQTTGDGVNGLWFVISSPFPGVMLRADASGDERYLADGAGRTLYYSHQDARGDGAAPPSSACVSSPCVARWPVFTAVPPALPSRLSGVDFGAVERPELAGLPRQLHYRGHLLYYYAGDAAPGETRGREVAGWSTISPSTD